MPRCGVCNLVESRYKCPTCLFPYCSVTCFKPHKTTHTDDKPSPSNPRAPTTTATTLDPESSLPQPPPPPPPSDKDARFLPLLAEPRIPALLKQNPELRRLLYSIYTSTLEPKEDAVGKGRPSNPYKITKPKTHRVWTAEKGIEKGAKKLGAIRQRALVKGESEGTLEEFIAIVMQQLDPERR